MHENPSEFLDEEKRRKQMLKKAIEYMEKRKGEDKSHMEPEDIVEAAKKFDEFVNNER